MSPKNAAACLESSCLSTALERTAVDPLSFGEDPMTLLCRAQEQGASPLFCFPRLCPSGLNPGAASAQASGSSHPLLLPRLLWMPDWMSVDFSKGSAMRIIYALITFYIQWNRKPFINMIPSWFREPLILAKFWHFGKTKQQSCIIWSLKNKFKTHLMDHFMF